MSEKTLTSDSPRGPLFADPRFWKRVLSMLRPFLALAAVVLLFAVADQWFSEKPTFFTADNFTNVVSQTAIVAVAALGMTVIIIAGGIDLSAGTAIALAATVLAWCLKEDVATRLVTGDSVASATARLKSANDELGRVNKELKALGEKSPGNSVIAEKLLDLGNATHEVELREQRLASVKMVRSWSTIESWKREEYRA